MAETVPLHTLLEKRLEALEARVAALENVAPTVETPPTAAGQEGTAEAAQPSAKAVEERKDGFDRLAYQREYMRRRRAAEKERP